MKVIDTIDRNRKKSNYHALQLSKFTKNVWVEWIKQACLFFCIKQNGRQKKWCHRIFFHLLTLSVVNAWRIYREIGGNGTLFDFIISISRCLISATSESNDENQEPSQKRRSGIRANQVSGDIHYDEKNHWPLQIDCTTQRCRHSGCSRRSKFICSKCQIVLCVVGKKCFLEFHGQM